MTIALNYSLPTSGQTGTEIFGLDVAVNNLVSAWFRYGEQEKYLIRPTDEASYAHCKKLAAAVGLKPDEKLLGLDPRYPAATLSKIHCLVQTDPLIADSAWLRRQIPGAGYALCGLIHTMSGERIARAVNELCIAPTNHSDALICPSNAIQSAVHNLWAIYGDYLEQRFGRPFHCPVELPVIPLGVDAEKFIALTTPDKRSSQRAFLQAGDDEIILLFMGRLSFATKAHPAALFMAAEQAAQQSNNPIRLVMLGYFKPAMMEEAFKTLGADFCSRIKLEFIANNDPRFPDGLWAGADIFISLVDNVQESFGLTPIEAMAAGLPVIVSDWDGYRDAVRPQLDGFTITTTAPPLPTGQIIGERYYNHLDNYGEYLTAAAQSTAIDIQQTTNAIVTLANDSVLRQRMGQSGRQRVAETYDWQHIIAAYTALWTELGQRRRRAPPPSPFPERWPAAHPAYPNPYAMFASFPSTMLTPESRLALNNDNLLSCNKHGDNQPMPLAAQIEKISRHEMNYFVPNLLLNKTELTRLAEQFTNPQKLGDVVARYPAAERDAVWRSSGWLLKFGVCRVLSA
jgi:starch synthase